MAIPALRIGGLEDDKGGWTDRACAKPAWKRVAKVLPLGMLLAGLAGFFAFGLQDYVSLSTIETHRDALAMFVDQHGPLATLTYVVVYAIATALSIPGGLLLTILGGFLFGLWFGTLFAMVGASLGAIGIFLAARTALHDTLAKRAGPFLKRLEAGFRQDALSYLLALRLVPVFPFWLVNLVPALLGVPLRTYALGTVIGIIPGTFVYASVGNGLGAIIDEGGTPDLGLIFTPDILIPIIGLAVLALLPAAYKRFAGRRLPSEAGDGSA